MSVALDIESYLFSKGIQVKQATGNNVHIACPFCNEDPSKRGRLYISLDPPGPFMCHLCGEKGTIRTIQRFFGDPVESFSSDWESSFDTQRIFNAAAEYYFNNLIDEHEDVLQWLTNVRGLTIETIEKHQLGWADGTLRQHLVDELKLDLSDIEKTGLVSRGKDFLYAHVTVPYHINGNVVQIRGKEINGKYKTPPGQKARLFNTDITWVQGITEFLVCEGEFDAMIAEQHGYAAVGSPGAAAWQPGWTDYFVDAKRVYIVFDGDKAGREGAEKVAHAVGPKARIVPMPDDTDISDFLRQHQKEDLDVLLQRARGGTLLSVYDAYAEWEEISRVPGLELGFPRLDMAIKPGLLPWQIAVILAKTNVGKTIFTLNLFHRMCMLNPDLKILFVSLEQTRSEWFDRANRIYKFYNLDATDKDVLEWFAPRLMIIDKNRITEHELVQNIEQFQYELGSLPGLVAVDYLGYWARSYKGEGYERTTSAIMAMKGLSKEYRISFISPHQVNRGTEFGAEPEMDSGKESGAVEETADFVMQLFSEDQKKENRDRQRTGRIGCRLGKSRHGGVGTLERLIMAPKSLAIVPVDDVLASRALDEIKYPGVDFEEMMEMHRTGKMKPRYYAD